jgi:glycerol-3-phosphate dehydrogenase
MTESLAGTKLLTNSRKEIQIINAENESKSLYCDNLSPRVRVLILGGGIHGVGMLHDLASRGWKDIHLVEKGSIGEGTSSRSTKLIHGGLRYLRRISQFGMVSESLRERKLLLELAPDLVKPIEILVPVIDNGPSSLTLRAGLFLYEILARRGNLAKHKKCNIRDLESEMPGVDFSQMRHVYSFWDGQTDDLGLVNRVAASARRLGAKISENHEAISIRTDHDGWRVKIRNRDGKVTEISALYVINCLGPWANRFLQASSIVPTHQGFNDQGTHLLFDDLGFKKGFLLQSPDDQRIFFILPWKGYTLVGTTETLYEGDPSNQQVNQQDVDYLLSRCNQYLKKPLLRSDVRMAFAGLRWLAVEEKNLMTKVSRESIVGERTSKRGLLMTIYGGKLTSYRSLCAKIGDRLTTHFGEYRPSLTADKASWASQDDDGFRHVPVTDRFQPLSP